MHRSGTSAFARGMQALGVYLGASFLGTRPDNPTGYWEDRNICELNERLLAALDLEWTDFALIKNASWSRPEVGSLLADAAEYLCANFIGHPLWGFKDPRTVRLLPFWQSVLQLLQVDECYVVAIRNPLSVAASLLQRQGMNPVTAHRLWLAYMVPYLNRLAGRRFVVVDYDILMAQPQAQLLRVGRALNIAPEEQTRDEVRSFAENFLDAELRHSLFSEYDFDPVHNLSPLAREAYLWLRQLATDQIADDSSRFWSVWEGISRGVEALLSEPGLA
jgi:hypothetical protein